MKKVVVFLSAHPRFLDILMAVLFSFLGVTFFATGISFLYPKTNYDFINLDVNLFRYEAIAYNHGLRPFIEFFDHKGLLHVLIMSFGSLIGGRYGIYLLEILFAIPLYYALYQSIRLIDERFSLRLLASLLYLVFLAFMGSGAGEGEWVAPILMGSLYFGIKAIQSGREEYFLIANGLAGLQMGMALNMRPLDALWGGALSIAYFVHFLKLENKGLWLLYNAMAAIGGLFLPFAIILPIASKGGYLNAMKDAFLWNFTYIKAADWNLTKILCHILILIGIILSVFIYRFERKKEKAVSLYLFVASVASMGLSFPFARYTSYFWAGLPLLTLGLVNLYGHLKLNGKLALLPHLGMGAVAFSWALALIIGYFGPGLGTFSYSQSKLVEEKVLSIKEDDGYIDGKDGQVYALDCDAAIYLISEEYSVSPYYANQSWWGNADQKILQETIAYLESEARPTYLFVSISELTHQNFDEVLSAHYEIFDPCGQETNRFDIYKAK